MAKQVTNAELCKELGLQRMSMKNLYDRIEKIENALKPKQCDTQKAGVAPETETEYFKRRIVELEEYIRQIQDKPFHQHPVYPQTPLVPPPVFPLTPDDKHVLPLTPDDKHVVPFTPEPYPGYPIYPPNPQWNPYWYGGPTCQVVGMGNFKPIR